MSEEQEPLAVRPRDHRLTPPPPPEDAEWQEVEVVHRFMVRKEVTADQIGVLIGTMTVQVEEPVVGYDDDMSMNELTIDTEDIRVTHTVTPLQPAWVVSWVYGLTGDGETSGGGFNWYPADDRDAAVRDFEATHEGFVGTPARTRLLSVLVPDYGPGEHARQRVTKWLDHRHDDVEYDWPAERVAWSATGEEQIETLLRDLLYLTRHDPEYPGRRVYRPHPDELPFVKDYLLARGPEEGLSPALMERFPEVAQEALYEVMSGEAEKATLTIVEPDIRERVVALVADLTNTLADPTQAWDIAVADFNHEIANLPIPGTTNPKEG